MRIARGGLAAVLLLIACAGCGSRAGREGDAADSAAEPVVAVRVRALEVRRVGDVVAAPGRWRAAGEITIAAPFAARLDSLGPRAGDAVESGERVGWLLTRESLAALRGAELIALRARDPAARDDAARALELARRELVRVPIVATAAGTVVRRAVEPGAEVAEGTELLSIVPSGGIVFEVHVGAAEASRLRAGQDATIRDDGGGTRRARLERLLPAANASDQTTLAWLVPRAEAPLPEIERFGTATIEVGPAHESLMAPDSALVEDDLTGETRIALVGADGRAHWRTVTLGPAAGGWHALASPPLAPGTRAIVEGQRGLADSTRVSVAP